MFTKLLVLLAIAADMGARKLGIRGAAGLANVFVQIVKCICPNWEIYLSKLSNVAFKFLNVFVQSAFQLSISEFKLQQGGDAEASVCQTHH